MDRRRRRWVAWDASFYDGTLGVMLRERFGAAGLVVFNAFICACKRSLVPGQIEYGTEADCLAQLGLPGLRLVDEKGDEWTLDMLWRSLADHKQIRRTSRGRLTQVRSSKWAQWQEDFTREVGAEKKRRSRTMNTETLPGRSADDTETVPRRKLPETDRETDRVPPPQSSSEPRMAPAPEGAEEEELQNRKTQAARLVAERRLKVRNGEPITNRSGWLRKVAGEVLADFGEALNDMAGRGLNAAAMADAVLAGDSVPSPHRAWEPPADDEPVVEADEARRRLAELRRGA